MITLYGMEGAASAAPMMLLEQAGAAYEYVAVVRDDAGNHLEPEGYLDLHPFGQVPTLVDGDLILIQSAACSLHLCERFPELGLLPGVLAAALAALRVACDYLADEIGAGPYLLGDRLTVADVYLAMLATWANGLDASEHWSRRPEMARHYAAVAAHPGFAKALAANGAGPTL
jgi:glutathione S-transferase